MKRVTLYVLFCRGKYRDVYASMSALFRDKHPGDCCQHIVVEREVY